ncbi:proprotein convertase P-domain-containing protein [Xanthomonadaceae bacterium JHOS43]|nr:proprotein convertase P-domain-containing protein [Xanthomonadaceae bacterium JHOS43]
MLSLLKWAALAAMALGIGLAQAQPDPNFVPQQSLGVDSRVDYHSLIKLGPWDDRNYELRKEDLAILPANDAYRPGVPVFFKILKRREMAEQGFPLVDDLYPREFDKEFQYRFGGLKQGGVLHLTERGKHHYTGPGAATDVKPQRWATDPVARGIDSAKAVVIGQGPFDGTLSNNETTIEYHPTNPNIVIAGSNGSGGQRMSYSTDGGVTWGNSGALPGTCCDPAVEFTSDGSIAFAATLGQSGSGCPFGLCSTVYWSFDGGQLWQGPVHTSTASSDKEFIHVDKSPSSPYRDRVYVTWHQGNVMQFARSSALPVSGVSPLVFAPTISFAQDERGIGSDIATDREGRIYYVYPSTTSNSAEIRLLRSDDGGDTWLDLNGATAGLASMVYDLHGRFDFAIPAMESRRVFIYAVVDVDMTGGPYDGRVYVAFTDENAAAGSPGNGSGSASASHAWIRVVYSDDQGLTWNVAATPHSTLDQTTVDRFQPWMKIDATGNVHIGWQDTRNSGAGQRNKSDWYYAMSVDGGASWIEETRVSSVVSENINNGQEWGDYNGLAVSPDNTVVGMTWTDNRIITPPSTTSQRSFVGRVENAGAGPSYQMISTPNTFIACAGGTIPPINVALTATGGFADPVTLTTPGLDAGVFPSAVFTPNPVTPLPGGAVSELQLQLNPTASAGVYEVTVEASDGGAPPLVRTNSIAFDVSDAIPSAAAALLSPADDSTGVSTSPSLNWSAVTGASTYLVEIASDGAFSTVVYSATVSGTTHTVASALPNNTELFWRVTASNACGDGDVSAVFSFTTANIICVTPNAPIPDSSPAGLNSEIVIANGGSIDDLDVAINITHTWVGDIIARLTHVETGTSVAMIDRIGTTSSSSFGCSADNIDAILDDEGSAGPVETACPPNGGQRYTPNFALSAFDTESLAGTWRLNVSDNASGDTGTLNSWCLMPSTETGPVDDFIFADGFED